MGSGERTLMVGLIGRKMLSIISRLVFAGIIAKKGDYLMKVKTNVKAGGLFVATGS